MINTIKKAKDVGIIDMQIYFPPYYVEQAELEVHDRVDSGKYTIGLGQEKMAFVGDREDINSICLTVLEKLMRRNNIKAKDVGRLEIGTETFLDKSKSVKTYLMDFFKDANHDIEGVTTSNACYGGTNALFNAINWVASDFYDGRYAIVICADIAVYAKGNARPTGGSGAVAMLIGPNAHIVFDALRSTYMNHVYDFYKPNPTSEYPTVDGTFSIDCYFKALDSCYESFVKKYKDFFNTNITLNNFDYFCFHSPFAKMVEKAFIQLLSYDMRINNKEIINENKYYDTNNQKVKDLFALFSNREGPFKLDSKLVLQFRTAFEDVIKERLGPSLYLGKNLGNLYTGSLYAGLLSLILDSNLDLSDKRVLMFSYGSGCAASMFSLRFKSNNYFKIRERNADVLVNLNSNRFRRSPLEYEKVLLRKEKLYVTKNHMPLDDPEELYDCTYYLESVDEKWRRVYIKKGKEERKILYNKLSKKSQEDLQKMKSGERRLHLLKSQLVAGEPKEKSIINNLANLPKKIAIEDNIWSGFHKKSIHERLLQVKKVYPNVDIETLKTGGLNLMRADNMVENCVGIISIPVGLGLNFTINSKKYTIPMAVEEPSVIAAVSNAAKLITENNGFFCYSDPPLMISQVHFIDTNTYESEKYVMDNKSNLMKIANSFCQDMVQRGGGVKELYTRVIQPSTKEQADGKIVIESVVDVCDSMGANILSTVAEGLAAHLQPQLKGIPILKIITNLAIYRKSTAEFKINVKNLGYKGLPGEEVARRIVEAYDIAVKDPFRCSTHNKGIMNGIDAVALALGQDWRALEAGAHTWASINSKTLGYDCYKPFNYYKILEVQGENYLYGNLTLPISVGTVGGAINSNAVYHNMLKLIGNPTSQQLGQILVAVGLGQNFAAIRALVSEGIQRGHMSLHARNFAIKAGVPDYLIPDVVNFMKNNKSISVNTAKNYLDSVHIYTEMRSKNSGGDSSVETKRLSSFYIEIDYSFLKEPIVMNLLLNNKIDPPIHFSLRSRKVKTDDSRVNEIFKTLFGDQKHEDWLHEFVKFVNNFDFSQKYPTLSELHTLKYKIKMIVIILYVVSYNMLNYKFAETKNFLEKLIIKNHKYEDMLNYIPDESYSLIFGLSVILELYEIMKFYFTNYVKANNKISEIIFAEIQHSLIGFIKMFDLSQQISENKIKLDNQTFNSFFQYRLKRLNATVMVLCDLAFGDEAMNEDTINCFMSLGKCLEIKITLMRDFKRYKENETNYLNSYFLYTELSKQNGVTDPKLIKQNYFDLLKDEKKKLREIFVKLDKNFANFEDVINNIENDINAYYKAEADEKSKLNPKF